MSGDVFKTTDSEVVDLASERLDRLSQKIRGWLGERLPQVEADRFPLEAAKWVLK